jgi:hypothetical protein
LEPKYPLILTLISDTPLYHETAPKSIHSYPLLL